MRVLFFSFVLSFMLIFAQGAQAVSVKSICKRAKNSADELKCVSEKYEAAREALNAGFDELVKGQEEQAVIALRASQQAWNVFKQAQCDWEASHADIESLRRMRELECLIRMTGERQAFLTGLIPEEGESISDEIEDLPLVETPRWLNALSAANKNFYWKYDDHTDIDLNCDGYVEHVLVGVNAIFDLSPIIAVSEDHATGRPENYIFKMGPDYISECSIPAYVKEIDNPRFVEGNEDGVCKRALRFGAPMCPVYTLSWDGHQYVFETEDGADEADPALEAGQNP